VRRCWRRGRVVVVVVVRYNRVGSTAAIVDAKLARF